MLKRLLSLLAALCLIGAQAAEAPPAAGTLKDLSGDVQVQRGQHARMAAQSGMALQVNDEILTGANGSVGVVLVDGSRISLGPNTQLRMSDVQFNGTTQSGQLLLNLYRGTLRMITGLIAKHNVDAVKVMTPTSVVGVRGTDFIVQVAD